MPYQALGQDVRNPEQEKATMLQAVATTEDRRFGLARVRGCPVGATCGG